jgi:sulfate adenylyltransferase subunit 1
MDGRQLSEAFAPMSIVITLTDEIDVSRGNMIVRSSNQPSVSQNIDVMLCWMNQRSAQKRGRYILRHTTNETAAILTDIYHMIDINTMQHNKEANTLAINDIGRVQIKTSNPIFFDSYRKNRQTGSIILIDESTNETVAAGMIV